MNRRLAGLVLAATTAAGLVACGDVERSSLCPAYESSVAALDSLRLGTVPDSPAAAADLVGDVTSEVVKLQTVADERHATEIDALVVALGDLERTLSAIEPGADPSTYQEAVDDAATAVADAAGAVDATLGPECNPDA